MNTALAIAVCTVFVVLALWHFRMALAPATGESGAVPSVQGKPLFVPSAKATVGVGVALIAFAALVAGTAGFLPLPFVEVKGFIHREWLVEVEADCVADTDA